MVILVFKLLIAMASSLLFILGIFRPCTVPPLIYALFPIFPAIILFPCLEKEENVILKRVMLLSALSFLFVSLMNTIALIIVRGAMLDKLLCRGFANLLLYSASMVFIPESKSNLLPGDGRPSLSSLITLLMILGIIFLIWTPSYCEDILPLIPIHIFILVFSSWLLMFLPWVYYLMAIWRSVSR